MKTIYLNIIFLLLCQFLAAQDIVLMKANYLLENQNYNEAITQLSEEILQNNTTPELFLLRGEAFLQNGDFQNAIANFKEVNKLKLNYGNYGLAKTYSALNELDVACNYLKKHLESKYKYSEEIIRKEPFFENLKNSEYWVTLNISEYYNVYENSISDILFLIENENYEEAFTLVNQALATSNNRHEIWALQGFLFIQEKNNISAIKSYNKAIEICSNNSNYFYIRAKLYYAQNQLEQSLSDINSAIKFSPNELKYYQLRLNIALKINNTETSKTDMELISMVVGNNAENDFLQGKIAENDGNYLLAMRYYSSAIEADPSQCEYFEARANVYAATNNKLFAINDLAQALDLNPQNAENFYQRAMLRIDINDITGACSDLKRASRNGVNEAAILIEKYCNE